MSKINNYSLALLPQESADMLDDVRDSWNFGKYQIPIVSTYPLWVGRRGETCVFAQSVTWALMMCTSDMSTRWVAVSNFYP